MITALKTNMNIVYLGKNFTSPSRLSRVGFFFVKSDIQALDCITNAYAVLTAVCPDLSMNV